MMVKDLMEDLEKGDRTMEHLKHHSSVSDALRNMIGMQGMSPIPSLISSLGAQAAMHQDQVLASQFGAFNRFGGF